MTTQDLERLATAYEHAQGGGDYNYTDVSNAYQAGARMMLEAIATYITADTPDFTAVNPTTVEELTTDLLKHLRP